MSTHDRREGTNAPPSGWVWWLPGLVVALGAAVATAHGLYEVAVVARVPAGVAWLYPLITDGLALVAYTATARLAGRTARYAWSVVIVAAGLSGLAQAAYLAGGPAEVAPALRFGVGAWPAIAAAVAAHLLHLLTDRGGRAPSVQPGVHAGVHPYGDPTGVQRDLGSVFNPGVQPAVQPDLAVIRLNPGSECPSSGLNSGLNTRTSGTPETGDGPGEVPRSAPRERAQTFAVRHAQRHGTWPTVSELEAVAAVSRGTAAAALKAVREHPMPLHSVTDTSPDQPDEPSEDEP